VCEKIATTAWFPRLELPDVRVPVPVDWYAHPKKSDELATAEFRFFYRRLGVELGRAQKEIGKSISRSAS
jgi:hypothetical protein